MSDEIQVVAGLVTGVASVLGVLLSNTHQGKRKAEDTLRGITLPAKVPKGHKRNSIMLLGIGGVGKTTLIRSLFANPKANPAFSTVAYELYRTTIDVAVETGERGGQPCHLFVGDYRGQDLGSLIREFIVAQMKSYDPMSYGYINTLVLMVDVVDPPASPDEVPPGQQSEVNLSRVRKQKREWNDTALDAVFGLLTKSSLSHVCLFINKSDLITNGNDEEKESEIKTLYGGLAKKLRKRAHGANAEFNVLYGSADKGTNVPVLQRALLDKAVVD